MTIRKRLSDLVEESYFNPVTDKLEKIADDYAIEFAEWVVNVITSNTLQYLTMKELLEVFKKEKGL
jgi:hypothetical protein